ncbi:hypothetical protein [Rhizosphaericola mali]|uniref:Uncharacterized protein n=1 Tax=Rhizosphaericola mali TaxID=2545455 RepID=A0A5P2FZB5_9BACT|nr:hypothetical protein [Rhizosphaericola mali]QES88866.1 hypothetical protein E0W69_009430 [Rhizosphaericola mali]
MDDSSNIEKPFTEKENEVMESLIKAHGSYIELERTHPSDLGDWLFHIHALQNILSMRILQRDYPQYFFTKKS